MTDENLLKAKIAEQAERYDDMAKFMKQFALKETEECLKYEYRNLLSVAYKNVVGSRRSAWRVIVAMQNKHKSQEKDSLQMASICDQYKKTMESELLEICQEVIALLDDHLIKENEKDKDKMDVEAAVFFHKMKADYCRYLCEVKFEESELNEDHMKGAQDEYKKAYDFAKDLSNTHPIRLGLALNYSVFYYEIKNEPPKACELAKQAFDDAIKELDQLQEDSYKDSTLIMQLIRDNLTLWTSEDTNDDDQEKN